MHGVNHFFVIKGTSEISQSADVCLFGGSRPTLLLKICLYRSFYINVTA